MLHFLAISLILLYHLAGQYVGLEHLYVAQFVFFLLPGVVALYVSKSTTALRLPSYKQALITIGQMLVVSFVAMLLVSLTNYYFPIPEWILKMLPQDASWKNPHDVAFYALMPAVCEEFFFRGFYLNSILKKYSPPIAMAITTLVFATAHLNPWYMLGLLLLGFYLSRLYVKHQNIWLCVLGHFMNNIVALMLMNF